MFVICNTKNKTSPQEVEKSTAIHQDKEAVKSLAELQLRYVNSRYQAYFHYGMNSFNSGFKDRKFSDWGSGTAAPLHWNPRTIDCDQWAQVVVDAGMKGGCLTTKHHDGFCLWDSKAKDPTNPDTETTYDIGTAPLKIDIVKEFTDAFRAKGLQIGLYYSIWDFHYEVFGGQVTQAKKEYILNQIRELLTNYGKIDYINFDGWNKWHGGGFGEVPYFDDIPYYEVYNLVKSIQPECLIINHQYEPNLAHSDIPFADAAGAGYPYDTQYMKPTAASDMLQSAWFWHEDTKVERTANQIIDKLTEYNSNNSVYTLNIAPNRNGRLDDDAIDTLMQIKKRWEQPADIKAPESNWGYDYNVSKNLAFMKPARQSSTHAEIRDFRARPQAEIALDGVREGNGSMEQTSMTNENEEAWWEVDLQGMFEVGEIEIYNRTDAHIERLSDFKVSLMDNQRNEVWSIHQTTHPAPSLRFKVDGTKCQYVKIQLAGTNYLSLAEVIVREYEP